MRLNSIYAEKFILCAIIVSRHKSLFYTARHYCRQHKRHTPYMHVTYRHRTSDIIAPLVFGQLVLPSEVLTRVTMGKYAAGLANNNNCTNNAQSNLNRF